MNDVEMKCELLTQHTKPRKDTNKKKLNQSPNFQRNFHSQEKLFVQFTQKF